MDHKSKAERAILELTQAIKSTIAPIPGGPLLKRPDGMDLQSRKHRPDREDGYGFVVDRHLVERAKFNLLGNFVDRVIDHASFKLPAGTRFEVRKAYQNYDREIGVCWYYHPNFAVGGWRTERHVGASVVPALGYALLARQISWGQPNDIYQDI